MTDKAPSRKFEKFSQEAARRDGPMRSYVARRIGQGLDLSYSGLDPRIRYR